MKEYLQFFLKQQTGRVKILCFNVLKNNSLNEKNLSGKHITIRSL